MADKRCAGPCLFRTCAGLHWGNQPARVVARDGDGDGVGVINRERVKRPSGIVANGKYGNALSVICANYVPPTPMPDQGCEPRVANEFARRGSIFGMFARANGQRSQRKSPTST